MSDEEKRLEDIFEQWAWENGFEYRPLGREREAFFEGVKVGQDRNYGDEILRRHPRHGGPTSSSS